MNNTYIKRWIAGLLVVIMAASAAVFADSKSEVFHNTTKRSDKKELVPFTSSGPQKLQAPQKEEEEDPSVTVNIILKYDEDNYEPWYITTDCHNFGYTTVVNDYKSDETYQRQFSRNAHEMVAQFMPLNRNDKTKYPILIAKDIDGLNDGETIVFDTSEATDLFEFVPVDEEGNPLPSLNDYMHGEGRIELISNTQIFGGKAFTITDVEGYNDPEQNLPYPGILTNPLSDSFSVQCMFTGFKWFTEDFYLIQFPSVRTPGKYINDKSLYLDHPNKFGITQLTKRLMENEEAFVWSSVQTIPYVNGQNDVCSLLSHHSMIYR